MRYTILLLSFMFFLALPTRAQTIEGDALINLLGTKTDAPPAKKFFKDYGIKNAMHGVYMSSKTGIRVAAQHDTTITTIQVYRDNQFCGGFKGVLPKGLQFKMSLDELIKKLGKPNYTSPEGQTNRNCVYRTDKYEFLYGFDDNGLMQAEFSLRKR